MPNGMRYADPSSGTFQYGHLFLPHGVPQPVSPEALSITFRSLAQPTQSFTEVEPEPGNPVPDRGRADRYALASLPFTGCIHNYHPPTHPAADQRRSRPTNSRGPRRPILPLLLGLTKSIALAPKRSSPPPRPQERKSPCIYYVLGEYATGAWDCIRNEWI